MRFDSKCYPMKIVLRILFGLAFVGSLIWIRSQPDQVEPYVSTILAVAALVGSIYERNEVAPNIAPRFEGRTVMKFDKPSVDHALVIENVSEVTATEFFWRSILKMNLGVQSGITSGNRQSASRFQRFIRVKESSGSRFSTFVHQRCFPQDGDGARVHKGALKGKVS